jgi:hypothetical protein
MKIDWLSLKTFIVNANLYRYVNCIELPTNYYVWLFYEGESFSIVLEKGTVNCEDFIANFKSQLIVKNDISDDGIKIIRTSFVGRVRMLHCFFVEFYTSTRGTNDDTGFITIRLRDAENNIITDESLAVITELDFCPGENLAYSLYGGGIQTIDEIDSDMTIDAILAPNIPVNQEGAIYFVKNKVLLQPKDNFFRNAINVGEIPGVKDYNVLRTLIKHDKGIQKRLQAEIQYYI